MPVMNKEKLLEEFKKKCITQAEVDVILLGGGLRPVVFSRTQIKTLLDEIVKRDERMFEFLQKELYEVEKTDTSYKRYTVRDEHERRRHFDPVPFITHDASSHELIEKMNEIVDFINYLKKKI